MIDPKKLLEEYCGSDYSPSTGCIHGRVYGVLQAMEAYAKEYAKEEIKAAYNRGYSACSSDHTAGMSTK